MNNKGNNYFETYEPSERIIEPHDFEMLQKMSREREIEFYKEMVDFHKYKIQQLNKGINIPEYEMLETYKEKEKFLKAFKLYRQNSICMEMYLSEDPYAIFHGDYNGWISIYEQRYKDPKRSFSNEKFK